MILTLFRQPADGKSVRGLLSLPTGEILRTLENIDYIIPKGTYPLQVTYSPRFKRPLPLVCDVPGRSGIRFHRGSAPEHSRGCILVSPGMETKLTALLSGAIHSLSIQ